MKTIRHIGPAALVMFALAAWAPTVATAQTYEVAWFTIDGGGGTSVAGDAVLSGSIAQTSAGPQMRGGIYGVTGGFWVITGGGDCGPCDANCDGEVNAFDIEPFIDLLFGATPCDTCTGDTNGDGNVDAFDIEPFLACLFP